MKINITEKNDIITVKASDFTDSRGKYFRNCVTLYSCDREVKKDIKRILIDIIINKL